MALDFTALISHPLVSSTIGGLIGSVVAPFVSWRIEKIRLLHQSREKRIEYWRTSLETARDFSEVHRTLLWEELKLHLTQAEQKEMFSTVLTLGNGPSGEDLKLSKLLGVVAKIQKEWGLV